MEQMAKIKVCELAGRKVLMFGIGQVDGTKARRRRSGQWAKVDPVGKVIGSPSQARSICH